MPISGRSRLFFDLETAPNIGLFWEAGREIDIGYESIVKERAIICAGWKWEGEDEVHCISWTRKDQDDTRVVQKISDLINSADEVVSHNGNRFDIPWVRGRCLRVGYPLEPNIKSIDTCSTSRRLFKLNSHRLDYLGKYLGLGQKIETTYGLWKDVLLKKDGKALDQMMKYCKQDVLLLEAVFNKMRPYMPASTRLSSDLGKCAECGSSKLRVSKHRITAGGSKTVQLHCQDCGKYQTVSEKKFNAGK